MVNNDIIIFLTKYPENTQRLRHAGGNSSTIYAKNNGYTSGDNLRKTLLSPAIALCRYYKKVLRYQILADGSVCWMLLGYKRRTFLIV